jgi:hypothetical protein
LSEEVKNPATDDRAHNADEDVEQHTITMLVDDFTADETGK